MLNDFDWRPNKMAAQPNNILILAQPNILILKCDMCYYSASCQTYLDEHTKLEHPAMKKYQCDQCDKSFGRKYHLKTHNNLVHLKLKDYGCEECSNNFATNQSLRRHITRVHLKREDFQCDECDEAFGRKSKLMDHIQGEHSNFERYFSIKKTFFVITQFLTQNLKIFFLKYFFKNIFILCSKKNSKCPKKNTFLH
jgi:uncharacterized Zn-finger protein